VKRPTNSGTNWGTLEPARTLDRFVSGQIDRLGGQPALELGLDGADLRLDLVIDGGVENRLHGHSSTNEHPGRQQNHRASPGCTSGDLSPASGARI